MCEEVVERFRCQEYVPGRAESAQYLRYMMFGRDPFIEERPESPDISPGFSAWDCARVRGSEICRATPKAPGNEVRLSA